MNAAPLAVPTGLTRLAGLARKLVKRLLNPGQLLGRLILAIAGCTGPMELDSASAADAFAATATADYVGR